MEQRCASADDQGFLESSEGGGRGLVGQEGDGVASMRVVERSLGEGLQQARGAIWREAPQSQHWEDDQWRRSCEAERGEEQ